MPTISEARAVAEPRRRWTGDSLIAHLIAAAPTQHAMLRSGDCHHVYCVPRISPF